VSGADRPALLVHTCCAACLLAALEALRDEPWDVSASFYNPNIHPLVEFRRRLKALKVLQERIDIPVFFDEAYHLAAWLDAVDWHTARRCRDCYRIRLDHTARLAAGQGFDAFTTTLLGSTHQDREAVLEAGRGAAERFGVPFLERDLRPFAEAAHEDARARGLYRQSWCGCIFSEQERYQNTSLHLYRGPGRKTAQ
jgi:predicted adenine nucleotide alpha hydrolase (AANH) superfamily ATPase